MGRGRAKAKQTKVARDLKYGGPGMDLDRLRADLGSGGDGAVPHQPHSDEDDSDHELASYHHDEDED